MSRISVVTQNKNLHEIFSDSQFRIMSGSYYEAPDDKMILIKGRFQNVASKETIIKIINKALMELDFDIMYLTKFEDDNLHSEGVILFSEIGKKILTNSYPMSNGKLFDASGDIFAQLHEEVSNSNINAIFAKPELFEIDETIYISEQPRQNKSRYRSDMMNVPSPQAPPSFKVSGLIWFIFVVFIVLIIAWALIKLGPGSPGNRREDYNKYPEIQNNEEVKPFFVPWF